MIHHAWSVLADRYTIDSQTNNLSVDIIESFQIQLRSSSPIPGPESTVVAPLKWSVVSLWYRDGDEVERGMAESELFSPQGTSLAVSGAEIVLEKQRLRTLSTADAFPLVGSGTYMVRVRLRIGGEMTEVARLPLEIQIAGAASA